MSAPVERNQTEEAEMPIMRANNRNNKVNPNAMVAMMMMMMMMMLLEEMGMLPSKSSRNQFNAVQSKVEIEARTAKLKVLDTQWQKSQAVVAFGLVA